MTDSNIATNGGPGNVDKKRIEELAKNWGSLPPREREANIAALTREMPPRYREVIQEYFRKLSEQYER